MKTLNLKHILKITILVASVIMVINFTHVLSELLYHKTTPTDVARFEINQTK